MTKITIEQPSKNSRTLRFKDMKAGTVYWGEYHPSELFMMTEDRSSVMLRTGEIFHTENASEEKRVVVRNVTIKVSNSNN